MIKTGEECYGELIRTKKLFFIGLDAMCEDRLGELQTSHVNISLQNTFTQHLWASHWTTSSYMEPCSIASRGHHMIYKAKQIVRPQLVKWFEWVNSWKDIILSVTVFVYLRFSQCFPLYFRGHLQTYTANMGWQIPPWRHGLASGDVGHGGPS
jgi:hypothetical protein